MPIKSFIGPNLSTLLRQAQRTIGADAVIMHTRRVRTETGTAFEVVAADPSTALRRGNRAGGPTSAETAMRPGLPGAGPLVVALIGPTGGGKTTTLAKLATNPRVFGGRPVGLVTFDTYRVGAVEQLRTYAEIARLPLEVAYRVDDVPAIRDRFADRDVILVDTPGRSPRNRRDRRIVEQLLVMIAPDEIHLVLPAAAVPHLAAPLIREARGLTLTHLLATKVDEAADEATLFELAVEAGLPMRWMGTGQEVPFDLGSPAEALEAAAFARSDASILVGEDVV